MIMRTKKKHFSSYWNHIGFKYLQQFNFIERNKRRQYETVAKRFGNIQ